MTKWMVWVALVSAMGCTSGGDASQPSALSGEGEGRIEGPNGCEHVCSPYDPAVCEDICPEPPADATPPADPYGDPDPIPGSSPEEGEDAGVPSDPYAFGPTVSPAAGHRAA